MSFRAWWDAGFTDLIPVTPPGGIASAGSSLKEREAEFGKAPGMRNRDGEWHSYDWQKFAIDPDDFERYERSNANIGLRTKHYPALDIDCPDPMLATIVTNLALTHLGPAPARGRINSAKRTLLYRTDEPFKRMRLHLREEGGEPQLIEALGDGQQFVVAGTHPSGAAFAWDQTPDVFALTSVSGAQIDAFFRQVEVAAAALGYTTEREGKLKLASDGAPDTATLASDDVASVLAAVAALPNDNDFAPGRDDYLRVGYAIKAALPAHPAEAFEAFAEWAGRWEGNDRVEANDPKMVQQDWARMSPPFLVGAPWLFEQARAYGWTNAADVFAAEDLPPETRVTDAAVFSDAWLAARFLSKHGSDVRYCARLGGWMRWDGQRWAADENALVLEQVGQTCVVASKGAPQPERKRLGGDKTRRNVAAYAATDPAVAVAVDAFDTDPWLLNTPAGVVDLRTGLLEPASAGHLFTRCAAVGPEAGTPSLWLQFLLDATEGDHALVSYLQRLAGYALTGSTREHILAFLWGPGGNGKGVFLNTLCRSLGSYAAVAAMDTFTASRFDRHPADLASLFGARLVTAQETQEGRSWDEAKVKSITGGDPITARYMRQDFFTFEPQFKLLFAGNHKPRIQNLDDAMRRRFHLVPFVNKPTERDPDLADKLRGEWPQILQWAIDGCLAWQREGLNPPAGIIEATNAYFAAEDVVTQWCDEQAGPTDWTETRYLYDDYQMWCRASGIRPPTMQAFSAELEARGIAKRHAPTTRRSEFHLALAKPLTFPTQSKEVH